MLNLVNKYNTCCFTGYRPNKLPWKYDEEDVRCISLKAKLYDAVEALYEAGIRHFICGMATGSDSFFCAEVLKLRDQHTDVTVEAALPCENQAAMWPHRQQKIHLNLVTQCDEKTVVSKEYTRDCMIKRNRYMVDNSSVLVAVYDGKPGGTMQTYNYARRCGLEIITLAP